MNNYPLSIALVDFGLAWVFNSEEAMSQIVHRLRITHHFREGVNCMLRYVLAQPVEADVMVILFLMAEYAGISKWKNK